MGSKHLLLLRILLLTALVSPDLSLGQVIIGRLVDGESMQPVPRGFVQLMDSASFQVAATYGDEKGMFTLRAPGPGEYMVHVDALSYHSIQDGPVLVEEGDTVGVEFFVLPNPEELDPLIVEAERTDRKLRVSGFYRRQERGLGQFVTLEDIEDIRPHDVPSLLAWGTLGIMLRPNKVGAMVPAMPAGRSSTSTTIGWCYPMYFLDGIPLMIDAEEMAFPIHPNDLAAVEVYATRGETPAQYRDARARCGTILLWTRR
jgi:hypothetical protein